MKMVNSRLFYTRQVLQNKQIATSNNKMKNHRSVRITCYFKNGLAYPNENSRDQVLLLLSKISKIDLGGDGKVWKLDCIVRQT